MDSSKDQISRNCRPIPSSLLTLDGPCIRNELGPRRTTTTPMLTMQKGQKKGEDEEEETDDVEIKNKQASCSWQRG